MGWSIGRTVPVVTQYPTIPSSTLEAFLQELSPWEATLLEHVTLHQDLYTTPHCLQTGQACIGVSDGSVLGERGAFGWCLSQSDGKLCKMSRQSLRTSSMQTMSPESTFLPPLFMGRDVSLLFQKENSCSVIKKEISCFALFRSLSFSTSK